MGANATKPEVYPKPARLSAVPSASASRAEVKLPAAAARTNGVVIETVAGSGLEGGDDGPLDRCSFSAPFALCRYGDSLFAVDLNLHTVRQIDGVLEVADPLAESKLSSAKTPAEFQESAVPLIRSALPSLPKELAQLMAQYACGYGFTRTIAGKSGVSGKLDGPATNGAKWALRRAGPSI
jgi:hypothetical protein